MTRDYSKMSLNACCICGVNDGVWFVHWKMPILFKFSFLKNMITVVKKIPNVAFQTVGSFKAIVEKDGFLYLIPCRAKDIIIYDELKEKFTNIELKCTTEFMFSGAYLCDDSLFCVPYCYDYFTKINIATREVSYLCEWKEKVDEKSGDINIDASCKCNDYLISIIPNTNQLLIFNIKNNKLQIRRICKLGNIVGICASQGSIYVYSEDDLSICKVSKNIDDILEKKIGLKRVFLYGLGDGKFIIDDINSTKYLMLNEKLEILSEKDGNLDYVKTVMKSPYYVGCWGRNLECDKTYLLNSANEIIVFAGENEIEKYKINLCEYSADLLRSEAYMELSTNENLILNLNDWLKNI